MEGRQNTIWEIHRGMFALELSVVPRSYIKHIFVELIIPIIRSDGTLFPFHLMTELILEISQEVAF